MIHAASDPRHAKVVDVAGTLHLLAAAASAGVRHFIYISIVGVDLTARFVEFPCKFWSRRSDSNRGPADYESLDRCIRLRRPAHFRSFSSRITSD